MALICMVFGHFGTMNKMKTLLLLTFGIPFIHFFNVSRKKSIQTHIYLFMTIKKHIEVLNLNWLFGILKNYKSLWFSSLDT